MGPHLSSKRLEGRGNGLLCGLFPLFHPSREGPVHSLGAVEWSGVEWMKLEAKMLSKMAKSRTPQCRNTGFLNPWE